MAGILLVPGPIAVHRAVKNMSPTFNLAVNKSKFLHAARELQNANFGSLHLIQDISVHSHVFVKKELGVAKQLLTLEENTDLCDPEEYAQRYLMPSPSTVMQCMVDKVIKMGLVPASSFAPRPEKKSKLQRSKPSKVVM